MILFIASILIAASVAGVFTDSVGQLSQAISDQGLQVSDDVRTDIEIISDGGACIYNCSGNENVSLLVKNTGSRRLDARSNRIDVLVNGQYQPPSAVSVDLLGGAETWRQRSVIRLNVSRRLAENTDHRVKVIVDDSTEVFRFRT